MTTPGSERHDATTHGFTGISDQNQLNPLFARAGEATDFPLNMLPPGESLPETAYQLKVARAGAGPLMDLDASLF